ncbi:hypothetical protein GM547_14645, partial [Streptococcus pneumoniae]|uniref:hypothetical protein n=1 Tax=Streptococcus pneumoniae TaxID=1313 RepID=UPI0012D7CED1
MFGGSDKGFSGGDALVAVNSGGMLEVDRFAGKNYDEAGALMQQAAQEVAEFNTVLASSGLRLVDWTKNLDYLG